MPATASTVILIVDHKTILHSKLYLSLNRYLREPTFFAANLIKFELFRTSVGSLIVLVIKNILLGSFYLLLTALYLSLFLSLLYVDAD